MTHVEPRRVLIVDDDADIRASMADIFETEGFEVTTAADGCEALQSLRSAQRAPHVIVLDLMMPVMNGYEFRAAQVHDTAHARIPVIVISADAQAKTKAAGLGVAAILTKPVKLKPLLELVHQLSSESAEQR